MVVCDTTCRIINLKYISAIAESHTSNGVNNCAQRKITSGSNKNCDSSLENNLPRLYKKRDEPKY